MKFSGCGRLKITFPPDAFTPLKCGRNLNFFIRIRFYITICVPWVCHHSPMGILTEVYEAPKGFTCLLTEAV